MAEAANFTPGPWKVAREVVGEDEYRSQIVGDIFILADLNGPNYPHQAANARLIAAAPDMLAALLSAQAALSDGAFTGLHVDAALRSIDIALTKAMRS